jgi:hypothetical protein
MSENSY